jgi:CO/xanthine dehydrogenase FAD-binding subunit
MRGSAAAHELVTPRSLDEALAALPEHRPIAGGTDLMVLFGAGRLAHPRLVDLWGLDELHGIAVTPETITFGALTTYTEVQEHELARRELPMLCQAAAETGGWAIQNRGTLGGNIANASPAADSPPALLAYGAELELVSRAGRRWIDYAGFHIGYKKMNKGSEELIARIRVPRPRGPRVELYRKVGPRRAQAISKVCFAGCASEDGVRIALGGVAPIVPRCPATEGAIAARAPWPDVLAAFTGEIAPIDDIRSSARYRRRVAENLLRAFVERVHA